MKKPNQRIGADVVKSDLVELHKSRSNKSATYALHFDTGKQISSVILLKIFKT